MIFDTPTEKLDSFDKVTIIFYKGKTFSLKELLDKCEKLEEENKKQQVVINNMIQKIVNPPYDIQLAEAVKSRTQYLADQLKETRDALNSECRLTKLLLMEKLEKYNY